MNISRLPRYVVPVAVWLLAACQSGTSFPVRGAKPLPPVSTSSQSAVVVMPAAYRLAPSHWSDVAKIRAEAQRLGARVAEKEITKVQAAQYLNRFRLSTIGANSVDDSMYEVYQRAAVDSQRGAIDSEQSKAAIESALRGWQQRWPNMRERPANPAFTNFLMEHMGMDPLQ